MSGDALHEVLSSDSYLEWAFLRWVMGPAVRTGFAPRVTAQREVELDGHTYRIDYEIAGDSIQLAVELDGFAYHGTRAAFTYDRFRQNNLVASGRHVIRFSYDGIRSETRLCVAQFQAALALDPLLRSFIEPSPTIETPD